MARGESIEVASNNPSNPRGVNLQLPNCSAHTLERRYCCTPRVEVFLLQTGARAFRPFPQHRSQHAFEGNCQPAVRPTPYPPQKLSATA